MKNPKLNKLTQLSILNSVFPALLLSLLLYTGWVTFVNLFIGSTEGGYVVINQPFDQQTNKVLKINIIYIGILEALLSVLIFTCGINFFVYIEDKKLQLINELIDNVIANELVIEDLLILRSYFAGYSQFKQQLKLVNSALEIRILN